MPQRLRGLVHSMRGCIYLYVYRRMAKKRGCPDHRDSGPGRYSSRHESRSASVALWVANPECGGIPSPLNDVRYVENTVRNELKTSILYKKRRGARYRTPGYRRSCIKVLSRWVLLGRVGSSWDPRAIQEVPSQSF